MKVTKQANLVVYSWNYRYVCYNWMYYNSHFALPMPPMCQYQVPPAPPMWQTGSNTYTYLHHTDTVIRCRPLPACVPSCTAVWLWKAAGLVLAAYQRNREGRRLSLPCPTAQQSVSLSWGRRYRWLWRWTLPPFFARERGESSLQVVGRHPDFTPLHPPVTLQRAIWHY